MGTKSQSAWEAYKKGTYTPDSSNTKKKTNSQNASTNAWENYKKKTGFAVTTQSGSAQNWADSAREHLKETESYLSKWHAKEDSGYSSIKKKNASLLDESYYWLREYSNDPEAETYIKEIISALDNVRTSVKGYSDHYGKWGTEDEYNTARKNYDWQQKYKDSSIEDLRKLTLDDEEEQKWVESYIQYLDDEEKGNYDLVAGQKEIDDLKAQLAEMEQNNRYESLQQRINPAKPTEPTRQDIGYNPHTMWQQGAVETPGITEEEKLRQLIAQKQQYLNQAKRVQESKAYADTVNNEDFDQFDDFVESDDTLYNWINDAQFREDYESLYDAAQQTVYENTLFDVNITSKFTRKNYDQMNKNEIAIFNYYYAKGGKKAAQKYLDNIQETLNKRKAVEMFGIVKDDVALEMVFGAAAGVNQFGTNVANNFKFKADYIPQSAYQIASGMVREDLADNGKLPEWLGGNSLAQIAYDAVTTTANMAPSILVGIATGGTAGTALMGLSAAGGAYQQALNEGFDKAQARGYSILVGASEAVLEKVLGGISAVGGNALGLNAVKNIANADNAFKAIAKRIGSSMISEFSEEYLQEVLDPLFRNLMMHTGEDVKLVSSEAIYSGILGALTGAFMEAPSAIYGEAQTASTGRKIKEAGSVNDLAKIGNTFAPETVAYKLAGKVTNDTGAYTIGQLFNEVNARLTDQNISEIAEVLVENDVDERTARQYAEAFAYVVENGSMPEALATAIEADPLMAKAATKVLFEDNTTWNQRSQGYRDVLMKLAEDKVKGKTAPTSKASVPADNTAEAKTESGAEGNVEPAKYGSIQTIKNGKVTVKMTDGTDVDLKDADLDPEDSVRIETIASIDGISAEDASGIFGILKAGSKNSQYDAIGAREAYRYGYYGLTEKMLDDNGTFSKSLTPEQRKAVYEIGNKARQQNVESKTFRKTDAKKAPGKVHYDGDRTALNERQQVSLKAMDRIASALGVQIYIFESEVGKNGKRIGKNGWYDPADGSIHIDLYAGQDGGATMLFTLSHELTHYIRQWSPQKFKVLADFLMEEYGKKDVNVNALIREQQNKAKRNGRTISYDTAYEEVVADSMEMMLSDGNVMKRLEKLKAQDKDLWSQIKRFIDDMAAKIRAVYKDMKPDSKEAEFVMEMGDTIYRLQELFTEGLMDASENFQTAEKNTTEDGGDILRSLREFEDGTRFVDVQMDANTFDGMSVSEMNRTAKDILMKKFAGKVIGIDNRVFVNGDSVNEYLHPSKNIDDTTRRAKLTAAGELDNLLDAGTALPNRPDGENGHIHPDAIDFSYYKTIFKVGNEYFEGIVNIKNIKRGKLLKDVTKIRNITQDIVSSYGDNPKSNFLRDVSMYSIRDDSGKVNEKSAEAVDISYDEATESVAPSVLFSERTWTESDYVQERDAAAKEIAKAIGVTEKKAKAYIDSVNSIAKMIADDRTRLDYFSSPNRSSFVSNVEYGGSFDFSTLCKKRRLLTGTFTAIQKALPNTALTANEILDIRNRMKEAGLEVSCGLCYVEGSRANMGQFAKEFLRLYKQYYPDAWQPNMADVNTPDGIEWVRINHPECYEQYEYFWNHYGTLKTGDKNLFASQQKPKLYQLHTEYKGEILKKFKDDDNVEEKNLNGGIRLQSFSDFEIVHLIDTMQIIMDMSRVGLAGQAYTKVPDFAWALGDTGLKINLSLIAKGVDENGKLIFDDVEGMPIADAMKLRDRYSANVGTILVAFNDEQLKAAMADDRVDFIIPFHRSQWKKSQYSAMGLPAKTKDYTFMQNEKFIKPQYHEYRGRMVKDKATNYMPNEYWDFSKSGKENAEAYLEMCARNNKRPKFYKLLENNGDGSYSLKADGSTDGYWKLLIDFKMYDNAGNGSPQQAVKPEFNMDEATRMLNEYSGGHSNFPVAQGIVDEFVSEYKESHSGVKFSDRDSDGRQLTKGQQDYFKDSVVRDKSGNLKVMYHGTSKGGFNVYNTYGSNYGLFGIGSYFTDSKTIGESYTKKGKGKNPQVYEVYLNIKNPLDMDTAADPSEWAKAFPDADFPENGTNEQFYRAVEEFYADQWMSKWEVAEEIQAAIESGMGYDGITHIGGGRVNADGERHQVYIAFQPEQIKNVDNAKPTDNPDIRYSDRDTESITARDLLSSTDVATIKNEVAKKKLSDYQKILEVMNAEDQKLREIRAEIKELSFAKGTRDTQKLKDLKFEAIKINNHISVYEGQLQRMEKELQSVVKRERAKVVKEVEKRDKAVLAKEWMDAQVKQNETLREYRETRAALRQQESDTAVMEKEFIRIAKEYEKLDAKSGKTISELRTKLKNEAKKHRADEKMWMAEFGRLMREYEAADRSIDRLEQKIERQKAVAKERVEGRNKTAMRHKIQNVVKELNSLLLSNDKKRHVPDNLKKAVAEALDLVNMDTVGAEERAAKYADLIAKEQAKANPDQDKIDSYISTMENILLKGEKMGQRLNELHAAYEEIQNSDDPDIANAYDPVIAGAIQELSATIGNTSIKNMSIEQLSDVYDVYRAVLTRVRDANKAMAENIKASIEELAKSTIREVQSVGGSNKYRISALDAVRKFDWDNLKPVYAMERIGSSTLTEVFNNVRAGEDVWARDVSEAREYYLEKSKKYGYDKWDFEKKYRFESNSGIPFELTLEQMMSLYAYSKREQAGEHLRLGGFVFDSNIETTKEKDGKRSILKYKVNTADAHQITPEIMADIIGNLTREQAMFVDEMQDYLSTVMGSKGNEVTSKMYGIKLFKEKFYFPLKSAKQFMFEQNEVSGEVRIKNSGFTNKVVTNANNPVILSNFMDVWSGHVNDMSMYHAFTLPLEDFNRVFNYNTPKKDGTDPVSVKGTIQNAYSPAAVQYVKNLITDLNGGARTDSTTGVINKLTGLFKKGAVFASLSVVVQQPSAIARATALIDIKYFIGPKIDQKRHKYLWDEVKQYAPVALIKEMGYFDTNMGKSTQDYITGKEYSGFSEQMKALVTDSNYRDEILSKAPAFADEVAWCGIWEAVKRETKAKHPSMDTKSEAFLKLAGQRFTEVITKTQVYDSVLARSANMRSKDTGMKMATAFMAEPTTSINMIEDAIMKGKRGDKRYARTAIGAVIASQILNSILVSFVYAARDDDEDETYLEKYIGSLAGGIIDGLNPATYIPFIKDIVSIVQGYDVERSDMAVVSDLWNAWKSLSNENVSMYRKVEGFAGSIAQIFGLPVKNIMRDVRGIYNAIMTITGAEKATGAGVKYAIGEAITGKTVSNKEQLYEARMAGDTAHAARVEARYDDMDSADAAVRAAIKDEFMADKIDEATALERMVQYAGMDGSEAHWTMDAWKYRKAVGSDDGYGKYGRFHDAVRSGNNLSEVIKEYTDNGVKTSTLTGEITDEFKPIYVEASSSERASMKTKLVDAYVACGMDRDDAEGKLESWDFEAEYGFAYSDRKEAYLTGKVSRAVLTDILIDRGYEEDDADAQIDAYEWEAEGFEDITTSAVRNYNTYAEPAGIPKSVFIGFWEFDNSTENDVDPTTGKKIAYSAVKKIMAYINSLNLTDSQKDALAKSAGWADKTIQKYKLW